MADSEGFQQLVLAAEVRGFGNRPIACIADFEYLVIGHSLSSDVYKYILCIKIDGGLLQI